MTKSRALLLAGHGEAKVMTLATPMRAGLHAVPPASLASLEGIPGIIYHDQTVTFTAPDFRAAYEGVIAGSRQ